MSRSCYVVIIAIFLLFTTANTRAAEVTVSLNEGFFDELLNAMFQNFDAPAFQVTENRSSGCDESIKILREMNGVRTAVRFRDGKVFVPLAFSGNYSIPFVGCTEFAGWAESNIDLEFNKDSQRLTGHIRVLNVNLNGTGGIGGSIIAKMLQGTIDKKINPIDILTLDKLSFAVPVSKSGDLRMKAVAVRNEVTNGGLNVVITYQFQKA